jgi:hypothetical protein
MTHFQQTPEKIEAWMRQAEDFLAQHPIDSHDSKKVGNQVFYAGNYFFAGNTGKSKDAYKDSAPEGELSGKMIKAFIKAQDAEFYTQVGSFGQV